MAELIIKDVAETPPKLIAVAPFKLIPVMVTLVPAAALVGLKEVIFGNGINVNPGKLAVP